MGWREFVIEWSRECRAWFGIFSPILMAFVTGWHVPRPFWAKKADCPPSKGPEEG